MTIRLEPERVVHQIDIVQDRVNETVEPHTVWEQRRRESICSIVSKTMLGLYITTMAVCGFRYTASDLSSGEARALEVLYAAGLAIGGAEALTGLWDLWDRLYR